MQLPEAAAAQTRWWLAASGGHTLCFLKIDYLFIVYIYAHHGGQRTAHRSKRMSSIKGWLTGISSRDEAQADRDSRKDFYH